jgi:hypothetical protein
MGGYRARISAAEVPKKAHLRFTRAATPAGSVRLANGQHAQVVPSGGALENAAEQAAIDAMRSGPIAFTDLSPINDGLPRRLRESFESRFSHDFSAVRVHADTPSGRFAEALDADAVTHGRDIYFAPGQYRPNTEAGQRLLAHELAHARQAATGRIAASGALLRRLRLTGSATNQARVAAIINGGLPPGSIANIDATGNVTLATDTGSGPPSVGEQEFATRLKAIIDEAPLTIIGVVAGGAPLVGSYVLGQIDVADMEVLGSGKPGWTAAASLLHEIVEQRQKQQLGATSAGGQYGSPTTGAHGTATTAELAVIGATMESDTSAMTPNSDGTVSGTRTTVFRYPDGTRFRMVVTVSHNNLTRVDRTPLP